MTETAVDTADIQTTEAVISDKKIRQMKISRLVKSTAVYFIGNVLSKIIVFFLLPIYTQYIPAEDMGVYDTAVTLISLFSGMIFLDIGSGILKFKLENKEDDGGLAITSGGVILLLSTVLYFSLLFVGGYFLDTPYYGWIILYGFLSALHTAVGACARALKRNVDYAVSGVLQTLILAGSNLLMILKLGMDYSSLFISFCIATAFATLYLFVRCRLYLYMRKRYFLKKKFVEMLRFSLPLCVNSVAFWLLSSSSRVIVTYMLGAEATGYLSVANKFNQILYLASSCIQLTWQEEAYAHNNREADTGGYYSRAFVTYYKAVLYCVVLFIPAIKLGLWILPSFIAPEYAASVNMIPAAIIGTGLAIVSTFMGTIFSSLKKTNIIFISTLLGAITAVVTNIVMIKLGVGPNSANYALILGYIASTVLRIILLRRMLPFSFEPLNIAVIFVLIVITTAIYVRLSVLYSVLWLAAALLFAVFYFRKELTSLIKKIRGRNQTDG